MRIPRRDMRSVSPSLGILDELKRHQGTVLSTSFFRADVYYREIAVGLLGALEESGSVTFLDPDRKYFVYSPNGPGG